MLQLLLERGQSYHDIGSLLGLGVDDVRARARAALTEIGGGDPDRDVGLTDFLLGQADPIGRADAARHLQADPEANALAEKLEAQLRLLAPGAQLPELPKARAPRQPRKAAEPGPAAATGAAAGHRSGSTSLGPRQRRLIAALIAGGLLVAAIVLIASGAFDDGGGSSSTANDGGAGSSTVASDQVTKAVLSPVDGGGARGVALFGRRRKVPLVQITAIGLEPLKKGQAYYAWLHGSGKLALPIGGFVVDGKGRVVTQVRIPAQALNLVATGSLTAFDVTLTSTADYRAAVTKAARARTLPTLTGTSVLRGDISGPLVGAAKTAAGATGATGQQGG